MTPTHAPAQTLPRRTASDVIRGLLAIFALTAFVIGVPAALLVVAPPSISLNVPTWDAVIQAATRPDDGRLLLGALQVIAWLAWAAFTASVITELVAAVRHISPPHIPLLGGAQRLAATLVTTAGMLLVTSVPLTATASWGEAVAVIEPHERVTIADPDMSAPPTDRLAAEPTAERVAIETAVEPTVTVQRGDTLWDLADRHLGDGHRYTEIVALNLGHTQADGRALDDAHWIYPGWQLRLPLGATAVAPASETPAPIETNGTYTVERGDTLWDIAGEQLGDSARYPEIVSLNQGVPQSDGDALTDPDLIQPGWTLSLPCTDVSPPQAQVAVAETVTEDHSATEPAASPPATSAAPRIEDGLPPTSDGHGAVDDAEAALDGEAPSVDDGLSEPDDARSQADDAPETPPDATDDAEDASTARTFYLGLTALAAAGVVGELARRRKLQQRARRVGQRIPLPVAGSPSADAERTLREAAPPMTIRALKAALLNLASRCYAAERDLPRLAAITLTPTDVILHLSDDDPDPVEPYVLAGDRTWAAPHTTLTEDPLIDDPERPEPFPALVTLGHTTDGTVLLNLEAAGTLTITGDPHAAADVLRALVAELATSDLTGRIGLVAGPEFAPLARACDSARLQCATAESLGAQIDQRTAAVARALGGIAADDTLQARSDRAAGDVWLPVVYITSTEPNGAAPWSGSTVIGLSTAPQGWTLTVDADQASLQPLGLTLRPQCLTSANLISLVDLLTTAAPPDAAEPASDPRVLDLEIDDARRALPAAAASLPPKRVDGPRKATPLRIGVLGPITIEGLPSDMGPHLSRRSTELLVYLAVRGRATGPELDEALWHGRRIDNQTRNSLVYRTRQRVGPDVLPVVAPDGIYRLGPGVTCDWPEFRSHARQGLATGHDGINDLRAALDLVRDRPFLGIRDRDYTWAEYDIQDMISAIGDVADVLARMLVDADDHRAALEVATKGLKVDPASEHLFRRAIEAATTAGDPVEAGRLWARRQAVIEDLDPEYA